MMSIRDGDRLPHRRISTGSDLMKCGDRMIQKGYNGFIKIGIWRCWRMQHECKITVLETKVFSELQEKYLANPKSGPCPCFKVGDTFLLKRTPQQDDFYHLMNGKFCGEAWDAVSRYVYTALQGGSIMHGWTNDERMMIACCNDGTRPVIFKIERIDIPESEEEKQWLEKQNFKNTADDAYTG